jgi:hypothetical protein
MVWAVIARFPYENKEGNAGKHRKEWPTVVLLVIQHDNCSDQQRHTSLYPGGQLFDPA